MRAELLISLTAAKALAIDHIAGGGRPEWTVREAAMACKGLDEKCYHAILFVFAGDESVRANLKRALWEWALEQRDYQERARKLREQGMCLIDIANEIGIETQSVKQMLNSQAWPRRIKEGTKEKRAFLEDLVDLLLCEVRAPWRFVRKPNEPNLRRVVLDVSEPIWRRQLSHVYEAIGDEFIDWLSEAVHHMNRRLRAEEREAVAA